MPKAKARVNKSKVDSVPESPTLENAIAEYKNKNFELSFRILDNLESFHGSSAETLNLRGLIYTARGQVSEALKFYNLSLKINKFYSSALYHRAKAYQSLGMIDHARADFKFISTIDSNVAHLAYFNLSALAQADGDSRQALEFLNKSIEANPTYPQAYNNRANLHRKLFSTESAISDYKRALELDPNFSEAISNYAGLLRELGFLEESISWYEKAVHISPSNTVIYSNYLYALCHSENSSTEGLFINTKKFSEVVSEKNFLRPSPQKIAIHGPLRIGFVGGDFYDHVVSQWFTPLFDTLLDRDVKVILYYNNTVDDRITKRFRERASVFRDVLSFSDDDLAKLISSDDVDILVDLSGHSGKNRLPVFLRRPAKLHLTWLGHPFTTGLKALDYVVIASGSQTLPEYNDWVEKFMIIPGIVAFPPHTLPERGPLPALKNGYITFGSLNRNSKYGLGVLETWASILNNVKDSRLIIADVSLERKINELNFFFESRGIASSRVETRARCVTLDFLKLHNEVDIALDTWPFSGGITASNCLHMGLPFVAMQGPTYASSVSAIMLRALGLKEWIATSPADYIKIASKRASDLDVLERLRKELPARMQIDPQFSPQTVIDGFLKGVREALSLLAAGKTLKHLRI